MKMIMRIPHQEALLPAAQLISLSKNVGHSGNGATQGRSARFLPPGQSVEEQRVTAVTGRAHALLAHAPTATEERLPLNRCCLTQQLCHYPACHHQTAPLARGG